MGAVWFLAGAAIGGLGAGFFAYRSGWNAASQAGIKKLAEANEAPFLTPEDVKDIARDATTELSISEARRLQKEARRRWERLPGPQ